jgi:hypothetical protein
MSLQQEDVVEAHRDELEQLADSEFRCSLYAEILLN